MGLPIEFHVGRYMRLANGCESFSLLYVCMGLCLLMVLLCDVLSQEQKGPFWVVYEDLRSGIYDSWPKATLQVNGAPRSSHKKFATFFETLHSFTAYCAFKSETVSREPQADTITDEEVDRVADGFTKLWLPPSPTDLLRPRK